jgi:hypothetical protein
MWRRAPWYKFSDVSEEPAVSIVMCSEVSYMKIETERLSETSLNLYQTTRRNIQRYEFFKSPLLLRANCTERKRWYLSHIKHV